MGRSHKRVENLSVIRGNERADLLSPSLVTFHAPTGPDAEAYRMLRTNLFYAVIDDPPKVVAVTSSGPREGKSTTCGNLGITLAQAGNSVLLLDCDLRSPVQQWLFSLREGPGLVDVLAGGSSLHEAYQEPVSGLKVVSAGHVPPNPTEILNSRRLSEFLIQARADFDYVLLDTPPVRLASDSAILAKHADGVLLVLDVQEASKRSLRQAAKTLRGVGANVIGTVMNKAKASTDYASDGYPHRYHGGG